MHFVVNLIITGIPSIQQDNRIAVDSYWSFKPYYNWNTFNTLIELSLENHLCGVLNLIITGIPSILLIPMNLTDLR